MTFRLSDNFIYQYKGKQPRWGYSDLSYFVYKRTYARTKDNGVQEEFWETLQRVVEGSFNIQKNHCDRMGLPWQAQKAQNSAQKMFEKMWNFKFLPPGRGLWIMGAPILDKIGSAALQNCFSGDTKFQTPDGVVSLKDTAGKAVTVLSADGTLERAAVRTFGIQSFNSITLKPYGCRSNLELQFKATPNHRWLLADGRETTNLEAGDIIRTAPLCEAIDQLSNDYSNGKIHGLIFGDGSRTTKYPSRHFIRLCDDKTKACRNLLESHLGYVSTTFCDDDPIVTFVSDKNLKELPNQENLHYLRGFLDGWVVADGHVNRGCKNYTSITLDSINRDAIQWVMSNAALLGITITGLSQDNNDTNFGPRNHPLNRLTFKEGSGLFTVRDIVSLPDKELAYCVVEPKTRSFTLECGIPTGNCGFISTKDIKKDLGDPFAWACDMLMLGVGVGFDTRGAGTVTIQKPQGVPEICVIPDTREGWVESVVVLINSYGGGKAPVEFDYSLIRKAGELIRGFGGTASGPEPLRDGHERMRALLDQLDGQVITDVVITDLMNLIGKFVIAGNVRRSAEVALGEIESSDFVTMKDPVLHADALRSHRWASNNSVFVTPDSNFSQVIESITTNGEPGLAFLNHARHFGRFKDGFISERSSRFDDVLGFNPCMEQQLHHKELCNLVETFPANHDSIEEFFDTLKYAYLYAKSVTLLQTHCAETNQVMLQNRRIGLSMSGIQQAFKRFGSRLFFEGFCDKGYEQVRHWDRIYSRWLGIPTSIRVTTVKPSGTISLLAGATPGVHCTHSEYYLRSFRVAANSSLLPKLLKAGYHVELSCTDREKYLSTRNNDDPEWSDSLPVRELSDATLGKFAALGGTTVVYFPVQESNFTKSKFDISLWEQLCLVRELQDKWSDNSVSVTVTFRPEETSDLQSAIEYMAPYVKTLSFLPLQDHQYIQAPYQEITADHYQTYSELLKPLRLGRSKDQEIGERFCSNDVCEIA